MIFCIVLLEALQVIPCTLPAIVLTEHNFFVKNHLHPINDTGLSHVLSKHDM